MAKLALSKDYLPSYARLPRKAQRKADEFLSKFERDSTSAAIHLEPIHALDPMLRSARIGDDYRVILRAPEKGDVYLVLWADHHDQAYRWAATKQTAVHPATGSLQIFDPVLAHHAVTTDAAAPAPRQPPRLPVVLPPAAPSGVFASRSDEDLFLAGVPRPLLPSVRSVASDAELDRLLPHLPPEAAEALIGLAAGLTLDEALEEVLGRASPAPAPAPEVDVTDVEAALARDATQRQFRLLDADLDLDAALRHPLDAWRIFLHPRQRRIARARTKGPVRVTGGAGTGKTVVAIHRAAFLANEVFKKPDDRILFTTFTANLADDLRGQIAKLVEPAVFARIEVTHIDSWAARYLRSRGRSVRPAFDKDQQDHMRGAFEVYGDDAYPFEFYLAEWREVVREQDLKTEDAYVLAVRRHRGVPLARADRRRLWPVFQAYREALAADGMLEPIDILRLARQEIEASGEAPRYRAVVVDEAQDFSLPALALVRAMAGPEHPDDLFLVGDAQQRIYGRPIALSAAGIQVRGRRSQTLRLNYRTTGAICRYAYRVLGAEEYDDLDDGKADRRGYVSVREGPPPILRNLSTVADEERAVVATVQQLALLGVPLESICIMARTRGPLVDRYAPALQRAQIANVLLDKEEPRAPGVRLATMHRAKGLEFGTVLLVDVSTGAFPLPTAELRSDDPVVAALALAKERSLLYVAASRARDDLYIFSSGAPSPLLPAAPAVAPLPDEPENEEPAPVSTRSSRPAPPASLTDIAATPIESFELPTRMLTWAKANKVTTLGELAAQAPTALAAERNLGRKSIAETREILERLFGKPWEALAIVGSADASPTTTVPVSLAEAVATRRWDAVRSVLDETQRAVLLSAFELPARVRTYIELEKLVTLGDLASRSYADLLAAPNLSRTSVADLVEAVGEYFARIEADRELLALGLHGSFRSLVQELEPRARQVVSRRAGLGGDAQTLQEIGVLLGFTRERARQLQARECERFARRPWGELVKQRFTEVMGAEVRPLSALVDDPFWHDAVAYPEVVAFIAEDVLGVGHVVEVAEQPCLWLGDKQTLNRRRASLRSALEATPLPCPKQTMRERARELAGDAGAWAAAQWWDEFEEELQTDTNEAGVEMVSALGFSRRQDVLALLRMSPGPMSLEQVHQAVGGRANMPDEVFYFDRGLVGLRQHFPDFETWHARLVPRAEELVRVEAPDRQWSCTEILEELREELDVPGWLTPWCLATLIRHGSELRYLGRLRVALPTSPDADARLLVHEEVERLLKSAGEPMTREEVKNRVRERLGATDLTFLQVFGRPQFVSLDALRVGLFDRDVPGGPGAAADALDELESVLFRRGRGLSLIHAHAVVRTLSADHEGWDPELTTGLLRADARFRLSRSGAVGLATWESTRVPPRLDIISAALRESGGRVSIEALLDQLEAHYGSRPARNAMFAFAVKLNASIDGDWMEAR